MTHIALITTTINVPLVLKTYVDNVPAGDTLDLVVAGDVQTPEEARDLTENLGGTYLDVTGDSVERWNSHTIIGLRSIQRRNLALLHALTLGPDVIITVDDDNAPQDAATYLSQSVKYVTRPAGRVTQSSTGWFNPGVLLSPGVVHRGFPISQRHISPHCEPIRPETRACIGVNAGLWLGDPDVDAIERIVNATIVNDVGPWFNSADHPWYRGVTLAPGTWAPFNTQNTAYAWDVAPLMQCLVGVGRYDDIWMSYVARRIMDDLGWHVHYGLPLAVQERNAHNLLTDMRHEYYGYLYTDDLVTELRKLEEIDFDTDPIDALDWVYDRIKHCFTPATRTANEAWIDDVRQAVREGLIVRKMRSES